MSVRMDNKMHEWALGLTGRHKVFNHEHPLRPDHFCNLTRDKNLQPILSFLIRHMCPPEERRHIKLNLKHSRFRKRLTGDEKGISPTEEKFKLKAAILDANSAIFAEVAEIQQLNQRKEELRQREVELHHRATLLKTTQVEREKEVQHCQMSHSQLSLLLEDLPDAKDSPSAVDVSLQRQLRGNLLDLEKLRRSIITGHLCTPDQIHNEKLYMWNHVGGSMVSWGPRPLMLGMISEVQEATRNLHSHVQNVDLVNDARELRLKCETDGSFIDETNPSGVIESVHELLGQMSASHVKLYIEAQQAYQAALSLSRAFKTLYNNVITAAKSTYSSDTIAAAVVDVVKENIKVSGERAALAASEQVVSSLQERADAAARARDALRAKHAQILSFEKEVQAGVESIQCLAVCVEEGLQIIKERLDDIKYTIDSALDYITYPTPFSINALGDESESFMVVPLKHFLTTKTEEMKLQQKADMSTTPLVWQHHSVSQPVWEILHQLSNGMLSWDGVCKAVCEKQHITNYLVNETDRLTFSKTIMQTNQKSIRTLSSQELKELTEKVEASDSKLESDVIRLTSSCEQKAGKGVQHLARVKKLLTEWWEQPAKEIFT